jgi:hypothetical protein
MKIPDFHVKIGFIKITITGKHIREVLIEWAAKKVDWSGLTKLLASKGLSERTAALAVEAFKECLLSEIEAG